MTAGLGLRRFAVAGGAAGGWAPAPFQPWDRAGPHEASEPGDRCGMCAKPIASVHGHVADLDDAALMCACRPCYLLFTRDRVTGRYRAVPDRYLCDPAHPMSVAQWDSLDIPVGMAFFLRSSRREEVAGFYPSPAGVTECVLDLRAWQLLAREFPLLRGAEPDVEAVLAYRADEGVEYFLVPVDACYALAGRIRMHWRGFDGGTQAREAIAEFLGQVRERAGPASAEP